MSRTPSRPAGRRAPRGEEGFALITTVLVVALLAAFSLVALRQTLDDTVASRKDQDWVAALGAAQAGLDDYLSRLNGSNGAYYVYNTANPDLSAGSGMGPVSGTPNWAPVGTAGGETARGHYHLDVNTDGFVGTASVVPNGNIEVTSTGRVGARTRTLTASVRRSGFLDFVYFTDLETPDPLSHATTAAAEAAAPCAAYYYPAGNRPAPPTCTDLAFSGDTLNGPVHSNDTMLICDGNSFLDSVTTASPAFSGKHYRTNQADSSGNPVACGTAGTTTFHTAGDPRRVERVSMPATNLALKRETSVPPAGQRGCLYVGPTKIVVRGSQLRVTSPWTRATTASCPKDTWFPIPVNGVVYVDVVPAAGTSDPNSPTTGSPVCPAGGGNNLGYPVTVGGVTENFWPYPCKAGDVFIEQEGGLTANALNGRLTVSANNDIYITDNLEYAGGTNGGSFLGLIAEQFVYVWHPVRRTSATATTGTNVKPWANPRIAAALLSVNHAISVQNHRFGASMGTLNITGALISKFRGAVASTGGAGATGYLKNYVYDQRLRYDGPPRFLNPIVSSFVAARTAEAPALYR
jgi:type II secretory pathway pseudopilin PulG